MDGGKKSCSARLLELRDVRSSPYREQFRVSVNTENGGMNV